MNQELKYVSCGLVFGLLVGCTSLLPMTNEVLNDETATEVARITGLTVPQVKDPTIHEVHEIKLSFWQMQEECYPSVRWYLKLIGSFPLACTKIIQQPWNEKVALIYYSWITDPITMEHEREHAKGATHAWW